MCAVPAGSTTTRGALPGPRAIGFAACAGAATIRLASNAGTSSRSRLISNTERSLPLSSVSGMRRRSLLRRRPVLMRGQYGVVHREQLLAPLGSELPRRGAHRPLRGRPGLGGRPFGEEGVVRAGERVAELAGDPQPRAGDERLHVRAA